MVLSSGPSAFVKMAIKIPYLIIEPYLFFYVSSQILNGILLPQLLLDNVCKLNFNTTICSDIYSKQFESEQDYVQKKSALWITALYTSLSAINIFTIPILGPLADTIGTNRTMYLNPILAGIQSIVSIILTNAGETFNTALLLLAVPIVAFGGDYSGALLFSCSYVADSTAEENRTFRINLLDGAYSLAAATFSLVSGPILLRFGYTGGFVVSLSMSVLNIIYLTLFVPDPRKNRNSGQQKDKRQNEIESQSEHFLDEKIGTAKQYGVSGPQGQKEVNESQGGKISLQSDVKGKQNQGLNNGDVIVDIAVTQKKKAVNIDNAVSPRSKPIKDKGAGQDKNTSELTVADGSGYASHRKYVKEIIMEANPYTNFRKLITVLRKEKQSAAVIFLLIGAFASLLTWTGEPLVIVLFVKNRPLNFSETDVGYYLAVQSIMWGVVGYMLLNYIIQRWLKCRDTLVISLALAAHGIYLILLGLSNTKLMIYIIQLLCAFAALDIPGIRSTLTKRVDPGAFGTVLAGCATVEALGSLVGSFGSTVIYAEFLTFHRGAAFFFMAIFPILASTLIGVFLTCGIRARDVGRVV